MRVMSWLNLESFGMMLEHKWSCAWQQNFSEKCFIPEKRENGSKMHQKQGFLKKIIEKFSH